MDSNTLVSAELNAGQQFIDQFDRVVPVKAAFWLRAEDEDGWYLYIASDAFENVGIHAANGEVVRIFRELQNPLLNLFQIKLVKASESPAREVIQEQQRRPLPVGTWYHGSSLGGIEIDGAYLYPSPVSQPTT